jgi:hypothetical protein
MSGYVEYMQEVINTYSVFVGKPEQNRPFERTKRRLEDNIRMDLMK